MSVKETQIAVTIWTEYFPVDKEYVLNCKIVITDEVYFSWFWYMDAFREAGYEKWWDIFMVAIAEVLRLLVGYDKFYRNHHPRYN